MSNQKILGSILGWAPVYFLEFLNVLFCPSDLHMQSHNKGRISENRHCPSNHRYEPRSRSKKEGIIPEFRSLKCLDLLQEFSQNLKPSGTRSGRIALVLIIQLNLYNVVTL